MSIVSTELLIKYINADTSSLMSFKSENIHAESLNYSSYCWRTIATECVWGAVSPSVVDWPGYKPTGMV